MRLAVGEGGRKAATYCLSASDLRTFTAIFTKCPGF